MYGATGFHISIRVATELSSWHCESKIKIKEFKYQYKIVAYAAVLVLLLLSHLPTTCK